MRLADHFTTSRFRQPQVELPQVELLWGPPSASGLRLQVCLHSVPARHGSERQASSTSYVRRHAGYSHATVLQCMVSCNSSCSLATLRHCFEILPPRSTRSVCLPGCASLLHHGASQSCLIDCKSLWPT